MFPFWVLVSPNCCLACCNIVRTYNMLYGLIYNKLWSSNLSYIQNSLFPHLSKTYICNNFIFQINESKILIISKIITRDIVVRDIILLTECNFLCMLLRYLWQPYFLTLRCHGIELFFQESYTIVECRARGGGTKISKMK